MLEGSFGALDPEMRNLMLAQMLAGAGAGMLRGNQQGGFGQGIAGMAEGAMGALGSGFYNAAMMGRSKREQASLERMDKANEAMRNLMSNGNADWAGIAKLGAEIGGKEGMAMMRDAMEAQDRQRRHEDNLSVSRANLARRGGGGDGLSSRRLDLAERSLMLREREAEARAARGGDKEPTLGKIRNRYFVQDGKEMQQAQEWTGDGWSDFGEAVERRKGNAMEEAFLKLMLGGKEPDEADVEPDAPVIEEDAPGPMAAQAAPPPPSMGGAMPGPVGGEVVYNGEPHAVVGRGGDGSVTLVNKRTLRRFTVPGL